MKQRLRRHFICVPIAHDSAPPRLKALFRMTGGNVLPFLIYLTPTGVPIHGTNGFRTKEQLLGDLDRVLQSKLIAVSKKGEQQLTEQVAILEKALADKNYKEVQKALKAIQKVRGYSPIKDQAYDLLDTAQAPERKKIQEAVELARGDEYKKAAELLMAVAKESAGLPVAETARSALEALKLLAEQHQLVTRRKGSWRRQALQRLSRIVRKYGDSPFAPLAYERMQQLRQY